MEQFQVQEGMAGQHMGQGSQAGDAVTLPHPWVHCEPGMALVLQEVQNWILNFKKNIPFSKLGRIFPFF